MKIAIVGPGAMGLLFAGLLKKSGEDVTLFDKDPQRAKLISSRGIKIEGISGEHKIDISATASPEATSDADLVILCVKSYDTEAAAKNIAKYVAKDAVFLTLQNGVGNIENIQKYIDKDKVAGGITSQGATLLSDGHIRHAGIGETLIGRIDGKSTKDLERIAQIFTKGGFETKAAKNVEDLLWSKLIVNVGINALTAITRLNNGRLLDFEGTKRILKEAVLEAVEVAKIKGIKLAFDDPVKKVESVCVATAPNVSSMLQDVLKKRKTEIDYINGAIVKEAEKLGLEVPVNKTLTALVKTIEDSYKLQIK